MIEILQFFLNKYTCNIENFKIFYDLNLKNLKKNYIEKLKKIYENNIYTINITYNELEQFLWFLEKKQIKNINII